MGRNKENRERIPFNGEKIKRVTPRLISLARPHLGLILGGLLALGLGSGINLYFPYLIKEILNGHMGFTLEQDLGKVVGLLIGLFVMQSVFFYFRHYCFWAVGYQLVGELRTALYKAIISQEIGFFDRSRVGDLLSRLSSDTQLVQRALTINISVALRYIIQVLGGLVLMILISFKLTMVILVLIPLIGVGSALWGKKLRGLSKKMQESLGEAGVIAEETLSAVRTVKVFAGDGYESGRYAKAIETSTELGLKRTKVAALFSSTMVFLVHSSIAVVIWFGGRLVLSGELPMGDLTAFLLYCVIVAVSFGFLVGAWDEFMQAVGASERIFEIIDRHPQLPLPIKPRNLPLHKAAGVEFIDVSFAYPSRPDVAVLKNLSFEIEPGTTVAFVGPSGSGKSTITALIPRFYDPTQGIVRFCGVPVNELSLDELRTQISLVAQDPQVFSISIGKNIAYGRIDASAAEVEESAKAANIHDFIISLPQGYDTLVGDRGVQLSGGQRQRIAIARALLKDPKFLILDEATSALDSENELLVQQALARLMKGRTTLIVAHRLSTVQHADKVIVLRDGEISQIGTHQSLVKDPGLYKTLVEHQLLG